MGERDNALPQTRLIIINRPGESADLGPGTKPEIQVESPDAYDQPRSDQVKVRGHAGKRRLT